MLHIVVFAESGSTGFLQLECVVKISLVGGPPDPAAFQDSK
jgi:hypothetical protein